MRHVINIFLLASVLLGLPMMANTPWGLAFVLGPFVVWGVRFLVMVQKSLLVSLILLGGIAYFQWQVALALLVLTAMVRAIQKADREGVDLRPSRPDTIDGLYGPSSVDAAERARWGKGIGIGLGDE